MLITEDTEQCQAEVTFDRELEGCIAPELKWREWTGRGVAEVQQRFNFIRTAFAPKKCLGRQCEAAKDRTTGSSTWAEFTTGQPVH